MEAAACSLPSATRTCRRPCPSPRVSRASSRPCLLRPVAVDSAPLALNPNHPVGGGKPGGVYLHLLSSCPPAVFCAVAVKVKSQRPARFVFHRNLQKLKLFVLTQVLPCRCSCVQFESRVRAKFENGVATMHSSQGWRLEAAPTGHLNFNPKGVFCRPQNT